MNYEHFDINNNLFQYQKENIVLIPQNRIRKHHSNKNLLSNKNRFMDNINNFNNFNIYKRHPIALNNFSKNIDKDNLNDNNNNNNNILQNNFINNEPFYSFSSRQNNFKNINNNYNNKVLYIDNINKNIINKGLYKTPQSKSYETINFNIYNDNNIIKQNNINNIKDDYAFYDIRVDYCLQMLNLDGLKNIFHKKNIGFNEMLYLSQKDMKKLGIPIHNQLIIQKFTKYYLQMADLYTTEELQRFFQIYYKNNMKKINVNKNFYKAPIRCFSPVVNYNKKLLNINFETNNKINNNLNYNLKNNFSQLNNNIQYNNRYKNITTNKYNYINNNNNNNKMNERNCLSASPRRMRSKNNIYNKKKENLNQNTKKQIQLIKNIYNQRPKYANLDFLTDYYNYNYNYIDNYINNHINNFNYNITNNKQNNNIFNAYMNSAKKYIGNINNNEKKKQTYSKNNININEIK